MLQQSFPPQTRSSQWVIPTRIGPLALGERTLVMGVINVTPDSFSDGGQALDHGAAVRHAVALAAAGADLLDLGGESTHPGAIPVPVEEELRRVIPVVQSLATAVQVPLSVDTSKARVAEAAWRAGASLINDVTALRGDAEMSRVVADHAMPIILMHMQGTPETMQAHPQYTDIMREITAWLAKRIAAAETAGIARERLLVDPGMGFGKTVEHNLAILAQLPLLRALGCPIVVGPSRKAFIGGVLNRPVQERLWGTAAAVAIAAWQGAAMVRVHDVDVMRDVVRMVDAIASERGHA